MAASDEKRGCVIVIIMHEVVPLSHWTLFFKANNQLCAPFDTSIGLGIFSDFSLLLLFRPFRKSRLKTINLGRVVHHDAWWGVLQAN